MLLEVAAFRDVQLVVDQGMSFPVQDSPLLFSSQTPAGDFLKAYRLLQRTECNSTSYHLSFSSFEGTIFKTKENNRYIILNSTALETFSSKQTYMINMENKSALLHPHTPFCVLVVFVPRSSGNLYILFF